jgi:hypothetical protein
MTLKFAGLAGLIVVLSGCAAKGPVSNATLQTISLCSAGHRQTISGNIEAKVAQDLHDGKLSATLASELRGLFVNDQSLPAEDRLPAYEKYLDCIKNMRT